MPPPVRDGSDRLFHKPSIHNELTSYIIHRVKNVAGYPESSEDILLKPSLLVHLDLYGDGDVRAMEVRIIRIHL